MSNVNQQTETTEVNLPWRFKFRGEKPKNKSLAGDKRNEVLPEKSKLEANLLKSSILRKRTCKLVL